ncbi:hypothetical protein [Desulfitobacterium sp. AusDCA]|uniref:hypothetical protein n=1 Tax=Desulfitobacterium sp. AusDCA TaxID=3240383 RepID=UPI003DA732B9
MNWRDTYKSRLTTAEEAVKVVKSGDSIIPGHAASESELFMNALAKRYQELENVTPRFYVSTSKSIIKALINMRSFEIQLSPIG